jgi:U3 small nucleolar RNA-associated protein 5
MPDLVARLSGLHATLTSRLALQESLLSLSGRLEMVLSQIELRSSSAPAPLAAVPKKKQPKVQTSVVNRYVEGESEDDDEMKVEVENDDDEASVEDIEFGKDQDETDEEEAEDDSEEDDEDEGGPKLNGFIDDEAAESDEDDSEEDDDSE